MSSDTRVNVHPISLSGYGSGNSEHYDKARPSYPPHVLSSIRKSVTKKDDLKIVELGCGTGIFTRALLAHPEWATSIAELRCSDPNEGMRTVFTQTVIDKQIGDGNLNSKKAKVSVAEGTFDKTDIPDRWADIVFAATAFHWCTNLEDAMVELERITAPGSTLCFTWNFLDKEVPWAQEIWKLWDPYLGDAGGSSQRLHTWRRLFTLPLYEAHFAPPEDTTHRYAAPTTRAGIVAYVLSASGVAAQPESEKRAIAGRVEKLIDDAEKDAETNAGAGTGAGMGLVWIDKEKGTFEMPFATNVVVMQRKT